ncbi:hypothetical protein DFR24_4124 [Panacagrimonas perspica]|uniref:Uncharacterized protein n=1 Tax=Panacagrimonas perspica TaxID=381431 RepID=A0A4R7NXX9_9GAMM|nr:hypothetical protein [Panacagrimonas perspica]TDU25679.1 hypothetical protein DFR24_4124 [Panacagrimonas perspica]
MYRLISKPYRMSTAAGFVQAMMISSAVVVDKGRLAATKSPDRNDLASLFASTAGVPTVSARDRSS